MLESINRTHFPPLNKLLRLALIEWITVSEAFSEGQYGGIVTTLILLLSKIS